MGKPDHTGIALSAQGFTFQLEEWLYRKTGALEIDLQWWGVSVKSEHPIVAWMHSPECRMSYDQSLFLR